MASNAKKPRKQNGYKMAPPIPTGFVAQGVQKDFWKIGSSIGRGGFGDIYSCTRVEDAAGKSKLKESSYPYAIKIEPQENGPLFVEMHFYMRVAKKEDVESWMKDKKIKKLGMPCMAGSGSFEYKDGRYRFIVLDRYGKDIWSLFLNNKKQMPLTTVFRLSLQILDVYEYMHDKGYAHCDVKGANLLLGLQKGTEDQAHLIDFGLATRYNTTPEFKPDPKKAHNGTIEYTSRDAHQGVITRRGDFEILGYNILHWSTSTLPWDNIATGDFKAAASRKKLLMDDFATSGKKLVPTVPTVIAKYLEYVSKLQHNQTPDYNYCRKLFKDELKKIGEPETGKLVFEMTSTKSPKKATKKGKQPIIKSDDSNRDIAMEDDRVSIKPKRGGRVMKKKELVSKRDSSVEDEEEECMSIKPKRGGRVMKKKELVSNRDSSVEDEEEECVSMKPKRGGRVMKKKELVSNRDSCIEDEEEECVSIKPKRGGRVMKKKELVSNRDSCIEDEEEECVSIKPKRGGRVVKKKELVPKRDSSIEEDEECVTIKAKQKVIKNKVTDENEPPKKTIKKQTKANGPSWKDSETVKVSGVLRAGEYVSSNPKLTKRKRKIDTN